MNSSGWTLIQSDWCLCKKRFGHTERDTSGMHAQQGKPVRRHSKKVISESQREKPQKKLNLQIL